MYRDYYVNSTYENINIVTDANKNSGYINVNDKFSMGIKYPERFRSIDSIDYSSILRLFLFAKLVSRNNNLNKNFIISIFLSCIERLLRQDNYIGYYFYYIVSDINIEILILNAGGEEIFGGEFNF